MDFITLLKLIADILNKVHVMIKREAGNDYLNLFYLCC